MTAIMAEKDGVSGKEVQDINFVAKFQYKSAIESSVT